MTHPLTEHVIRFPELPAGHELAGLVFAPSRKAVCTPMAALLCLAGEAAMVGIDRIA